MSQIINLDGSGRVSMRFTGGGSPRILELEYDPAMDVLTVEGVRYSGDFFRFFREPVEDNRLHRVAEKLADGAVVVQTVTDKELARRFELVFRAGGGQCTT